MMAIPGILGTILALVTGNPKVGLFLAKYPFSYLLFPICFSKISVHGLDKVNWKDVHLFVSNHESLLDIPAIFLVCPKYLYFITKMELKKTPFIGWLGRAVGMIFIDRKNPERARATIVDAGRQIKNGKNIISFAEGTRSQDETIGRFKKGSFMIALESEIDIIPIRIIGARDILPSGSFRLRPGHVHVYFGEKIEVKSFDKSKPEVLANHVRETVIGMA